MKRPRTFVRGMPYKLWKQNYDRERTELRRRSPRHKLIKLLELARARAKKAGIPFSITIDDVEIPKRCPLLGIKISYGNKGVHRDDSPSLDRINPKRGYVPGNVWIVSHKANAIKNDATLHMLFKLTRNLKKQLDRMKGASHDQRA